MADHQLRWLFDLRDEVGIRGGLCRVVDVFWLLNMERTHSTSWIVAG